MGSRAKEMGYGSAYRFDAHPDANAFQFMDKSPPASIQEYPLRPEDSVSMTAQRKYSDVGVIEEPQQDKIAHKTSKPLPRKHGFLAVSGSWVWELLSCVIALGALAGIFLVLRKFNGQALRNWPHSATINTVLSILITVIKAAIIVPLAEGISQLKWSWYRKRDQALKDIVIFDEASRDAAGATRLILSVSPVNLASLASILLLASFAIGPFAQQIVQISQREILSSDVASIPVCNGRYNDIRPGTSGGSAPGLLDIGLPTIGAIYDGILQNSSTTPIETTCRSGNCTFEPYQSLGFCSRCADISSELVPHHPRTGQIIRLEDCPTDTGCIYDLRNKTLRSYLNVGTAVNTTSNSLLLHPDLKDITGVVNVTALYGETDSRRSKPANVSAFECTLYFCVQQYEGKISGGSLNESSREVLSKTEFEGPFPWTQVNVTITPEKCVKDGATKTPPYAESDTCSYSFYGMNGRALYEAINPLFKGSATIDTSLRPYWSSVIMQRIGENNGNQIDTIDTVFKNLAKRLTRHIRAVPTICKGEVMGSVWYTEAFISVRWKWITLPIVVVGATFVLLLIIMVKTRKEYIWKSSPLALVFLGMQDSRQSDGETHPIFPKSPGIESLIDSAGEIRMHLDGSGRWQIFGNE